MNHKSIPSFLDTLVIGAGAAGLFCAAQAGQRGHRVAVIDHSEKPAEKIRISGGGRCNFTNINTKPKHFISENPHFAKSALARYSPQDFLTLLRRHEITWNDKGHGQLFCDGRAGQIINMLIDELTAANASMHLGVTVSDITNADGKFCIETDQGNIFARQVVIATGGLSIPKIGASSFAYDVAKRFGHDIVETRPALVPFTFSGQQGEDFASLAGVASPVKISIQDTQFEEAMLFTHRGLSGPAVLQISSYWRDGEKITVDLLSGIGGIGAIKGLRDIASAKQVDSAMEALLPKRLAEYLAAQGIIPKGKFAETGTRTLEVMADKLAAWQLTPTGTEGYRTAEVTLGGISTRQLSSKTMESSLARGLYFIGEAVDVTGWLGGYNFQWAWASAFACAQGLPDPIGE